ncbi:hypothetical protein EST38_g7084 [Candolleomyces aberdarensis]|uniref:Uncharacterized protein n=1 Tax=Candolleomyces aberdarensis TaxID=2316362 RepID=A0A4Q2DI56_9AGAR|nr:hypothetical protein EST38_g7084 [Candolleomyces aberdarensis]
MHQPAIIDIKNPCYCPSLPAAAYLQAIRQSVLLGTTYRRGSLFDAFARMLGESGSGSAADDMGSVNFKYDSDHDWIVGVNLGNRRRGAVNQRGLPKRIPLPSVTNSPSTAIDEFTLSEHPPNLQSTLVNEQGGKRKRDSSSSDVEDAPAPKYAKSILVAHDSSFELEVEHEKVNFDVTGSPTLNNPSKPHDNGYAPGLFELASLEEVLTRVLALLPGIRLEERLGEIHDLTIQKMADFLAENGYMNHHILNSFRRTDVTSLSLVASLFDEDGLNICGQEVIEVFGKPFSFQHLTELSFGGSRVEDFHLVHIHHLPKLSTLNLNNTGIGNEAIYLLVPLKKTLKRLSVATNPDVTSVSAPALLLLVNLDFLSILDTGVDMVGLRTLAGTIFEESRNIDIEIPYACEAYIDNLQSMYLVDVQPPLIDCPDACSSLNVSALKKNLAAHAEKNPSISTAGARGDMIARLQEILTRRKLDLIVAQMLLGGV